MNRPVISLVLHNIRSTHNVGSIFRTSDGFGVQHIYVSGYTPYPAIQNDTRLPHIVEKLTNDIAKTALGAEKTVSFSYVEHIESSLNTFQAHGYSVIGLEQNDQAIHLPDFIPPQKIMLVLGEEIDGIPIELQQKCDQLIEIPMQGQKESFNVSVAAGIALYGISYSKRYRNF